MMLRARPVRRLTRGREKCDAGLDFRGRSVEAELVAFDVLHHQAGLVLVISGQ